MNMEEVLLQWFMNFLIKHPQVINCIKTKNMLDQQLPGELHKPIIRKSEKRKAH